jgi:hypothetical protein
MHHLDQSVLVDGPRPGGCGSASVAGTGAPPRLAGCIACVSEECGGDRLCGQRQGMISHVASTTKMALIATALAGEVVRYISTIDSPDTDDLAMVCSFRSRNLLGRGGRSW